MAKLECFLFIVFEILIQAGIGTSQSFQTPVLKNYVTFFTRPLQRPVNIHDLGVDINNANAIKFFIRSCGGVKIMLHPRPIVGGVADSQLFEASEIVLGEKIPQYDVFLSFLRPCKFNNRPDCKPEAYHPINPMDCLELKPFWVIWDQTGTFVGEGTLFDRQQLVRAVNASSAYSMISVTAESDAYWVFPPNDTV